MISLFYVINLSRPIIFRVFWNEIFLLLSDLFRFFFLLHSVFLQVCYDLIKINSLSSGAATLVFWIDVSRNI